MPSCVTAGEKRALVISVNSNNLACPSSVIYIGDKHLPYRDELQIRVTNGR